MVFVYDWFWMDGEDVWEVNEDFWEICEILKEKKRVIEIKGEVSKRGIVKENKKDVGKCKNVKIKKKIVKYEIV